MGMEGRGVLSLEPGQTLSALNTCSRLVYSRSFVVFERTCKVICPTQMPFAEIALVQAMTNEGLRANLRAAKGGVGVFVACNEPS